MKEPVARSDLRLALGGAYYGTLRKLLWIKERRSFTRERCEAILPYSAASHKTPLMAARERPFLYSRRAHPPCLLQCHGGGAPERHE